MKMRRCILILMVPLNSLEKWVFFNNYGKTTVLILYYQLPFLQNGRFGVQSGPQCIGLGCSGILQDYPVFLKFETHLKIELRTGRTEGVLVKYLSAIEKLDAWMWWNLFWSMPERSMSQSNLSCLEIDHFRNTATDTVNLGQYLQQNCLKTNFFKVSQWYHQNLNTLSHFYLTNVSNK